MVKNVLLFVDDQIEILNSLKRMFQKDYDILTSTKGTKALEILKEQMVSVILSDQRMPEMDGFVVIRAIREHQDSDVASIPNLAT